MFPLNNKILVKVNLSQKRSFTINGITFSTATNFEKNYREKSPVIAEVIEGNNVVKEGDIIICHHNHFHLPSPYHLYDNVFSIPFGKTIFAKLDNDGNLFPLCGNLLCERVEVESFIPLPNEQIKTHLNRALIKDAGETKYKSNQLIFHRPSAGYDIVYIWDGLERRVTKVHEEQICGILN